MKTLSLLIISGIILGVISPLQSSFAEMVQPSLNEHMIQFKQALETTKIISEETSKPIPPPLKQFKSGVPSEEIQCRRDNMHDLMLVMRSEDKSPTCIYASNYLELEQRGWLVGYSMGQYDALALKTAKKFILSTPTFKFDGIEKTLILNENGNELTLPPVFTFRADFSTLHPGYGDRTGQPLANQITNHTMEIMISHVNRVTSAIIDDRWDEANQIFLDKNKKQ